MDLPTTRFANNLRILLDNLDVARQLLSIPTCSSQVIFSRFTSKARKWPERARLPHTQPGEVCVHWIPGHSAILGNALADRAAKEAMDMALPPSPPLTFASAKAWVKNVTATAYKEYWTQHAPKSYQDLEIKFRTECPTELSLPRHHAARIYAARSGHGDFASYHIRFEHASAHTTCTCGGPKYPSHFLHCPLPKSRPPKPPKCKGRKIIAIRRISRARYKRRS